MSGSASSDRELPAALRFMQAAGQRELQDLTGLVAICGLATLLGQLAHDLQRECGWTIVCLGLPLPEHLAVLQEYGAAASRSEAELRRRLEAMDLAAGTERHRLLARIAHLLDALEGLPRLRRRVHEQRADAAQATRVYTQLIGSVLAVVFEAADSGLDPQVARALAALCNFMQGKELAGQERAMGVAGFSAGWFDAPQQAAMRQLQLAQQRSFDAFRETAEDASVAKWSETLADQVEPELARLRTVAARTSSAQRIEAPLAEPWFDVCTRRMDAMREVENLLCDALLEVCRRSLNRARTALDSRRALSERLSRLGSEDSPLLHDLQAPMRLHQLNEELSRARALLEERAVLDKAKRRLESELGLSEQAAHEKLQRASMNSGMRVADVARKIVS